MNNIVMKENSKVNYDVGHEHNEVKNIWESTNEILTLARQNC